MTHHDALEAYRRAIGSRPDCGGDLVDLGPDLLLEGCTVWACSLCGHYLSVDPAGIIRDKGPMAILGADRRSG